MQYCYLHFFTFQVHSIDKVPLFLTMESDNVPIPTIHTLWRIPDLCKLFLGSIGRLCSTLADLFTLVFYSVHLIS